MIALAVKIVRAQTHSSGILHPMAKTAGPEPPPFRSFVPSLLLKTLRSSLFFIADTARAAVIIFCIWAFSQVFHALWGPEDPLLFDRFPLRYLFDAGDLGVIIVYVGNLVRQALAEFR
jgi:hypothetical protein